MILPLWVVLLVFVSPRVLAPVLLLIVNVLDVVVLVELVVLLLLLISVAVGVGVAVAVAVAVGFDIVLLTVGLFSFS